MKFLFLLTFLLSPNLYASTLDDLAHHPVWLRLLHWNGSSSRIDAPDFFLAPNGDSDARAELLATIKAFQEKLTPAGDPWPAACSFPARYQFLKEMKIELPAYQCQDYQWWRDQLPIKSVSMVFSSYYPGNPASIFGHTFLKLNTTADHHSKLTDYTVSFSAFTTDSMGLIYAFKGLFGGYRGFFAMSPYYMKINEYVNSESRDLWEYPLQLTSSETDRMLAHLWELMKKGWSSYWFTDENCSFQLLALIDAAIGHTSMANDSDLIVLPSNTLKQLEHNHILSGGEIRPSYRKQVSYRYSLLDSTQKDEFHAELTHAKESQDSMVLDAVIAKIRFDQLEVNENKQEHERIGKILNQVLKRRAALAIKTRPFAEHWKNSMDRENPLRSHRSHRLDFSAGVRNSESLFRLSARMGLHSPTDRANGLPHHSQLTYLAASLEHSKDKVRLGGFQLLEILSLEPKTAASFPWSWRAHVGGTRRLGYPDGLAPQLGLSIGKTLAPHASTSLYALLGVEVAAFAHMDRSFAYGPTSELGLIYTAKWIRLQWQIQALFDLPQHRPWIKTQLVSQWDLNSRWELAVHAARTLNTPYQEFKNSDEYLAMLVRHF